MGERTLSSAIGLDRSEYEIKLRDEFAKIAFDALMRRADLKSSTQLEDTLQLLPVVAQKFADKAMEARNAK